MKVVALAVVAWGSWSLACAAAAPSVFWLTDPVDPGDTMIFAGADLDGATLDLTRLPDGATATTAAAPPERLKLIQPGPTSLKARVPTSFSPGVYRYRLETASGTSTGYVNRATVYWSQGDRGARATVGGWIRVMGRNIARAPGAQLQLIGPDMAVVTTLPIAEGGLWDGRFAVPSNLPVGTYALKLWNGAGSAETIVEAGSIDIVAVEAWPATTVNIKQFGARGDAARDDTDSFRRALQHLRDAGGGTLFVPRGRYLLTGSLTIPENTAIMGADPAASILVLKDTDQPPNVLLDGTRRFRLRNFAINASRHGYLVRGGFDPSGAPIADADIVIDGLVIRANLFRGHNSTEEMRQRLEAANKAQRPRGPDALNFGGGNITVTNSDVQASMSTLMLKSARNAYVANNRFENGRQGWYAITNPDGVIFENNTIIGADLESGGGGVNTIWGPERAIAQNVLVKNNRFSNHPGGDGESMTTDSPGGCYTGPAMIQAGGSVAQLPGLSAEAVAQLDRCWQAGGLVILSGRGVGAFARVNSTADGMVQLRDPFPVATDETSIAVLVPVQRRVLAIGNESSDVGIAIQFYASNWEQVAAGNKTERSAGYRVWGKFYKRALQPAIFTQFIGNSLQTGTIDRRQPHGFLDSAIAVVGTPTAPNTEALVRGVVIRNNKLRDNAVISVIGQKRPAPGVVDVVIENNTLERADRGISIDVGVRGAVVGTNAMRDVLHPIVNLSVPWDASNLERGSFRQ